MSEVIKPRPLHPGDRVALVAPASPFKREEFEAGVAEIRRLGFEPVFDERVFARRGFEAGTPELRAEAITDAWRDPTVAALIAVRGGYGSVHVLPWLDPETARASRKALVGYSDLTSLLTFLTLDCGVVAFHGPMVVSQLGRGEEGYDRASLLRALTVEDPLGELAPPSLEVLNPGEASGRVYGGTMTQLLASLGTPFAFDPPAGHILFLEEVAERPYRLDRMVTQLRLAGILARASAIVWGQLRDCDEPWGDPTARGVIADLMRDFPGPVLYGFPSGHTTVPSQTLPLGVRGRVVAHGTPRLVIEEAAVER